MLRFGEWVAKHRVLILLLGIVLLIPSAIGYANTRVNYDILSYLPKDIDTMTGQDILKDEFGQGGFSLVMIEGMSDKDVAKTAHKFEEIDHVSSVVCYQSLTDCEIPMEILPEKYIKAFNNGDTTMMAVFFDDTTSADGTLAAVDKMRDITDKQCFISGMSAITLDMKNLSKSESIIYAVIAVLLMEPRYEYLPRRDIIPHKSPRNGAPARRHDGLLYIPLAQLQGTARDILRQ